MLKTKRNMVLALTLCGLLAPTMASVENPVERPQKVWGNLTATVTEVDWANLVLYYEVIDIGHATHIGRYVNVGAGIVDLLTFLSTATGQVTAANGDTIEWTTVELGPTQIEITFTTGTGRFEGVSGVVVADHEAVVLVPVVGAEVSYSYTGTGWIKY